MKLIYGGVPYNTTKVRHYETNTNDATLQSSDLQAGITAYARGQKITGSGRSFEFAIYGGIESNDPWFVPNTINVIHINSLEYPTQSNIALNQMKDIDFSKPQTVANITVDDIVYPISVIVEDNMLTIGCEKTLTFQVFYGKDNYV